jgi:hypothetical protein
MVTWVAIIHIRGGHDIRIEVRAPSQYDARQLIQMQYRDAILLSGPYRLDLMRAI